MLFFSPGVDVGFIIAVAIGVGTLGTTILIRETVRANGVKFNTLLPQAMVIAVIYSLLALHGPPTQVTPHLVPGMEGQPTVLAAIGLIVLVISVLIYCSDIYNYSELSEFELPERVDSPDTDAEEFMQDQPGSEGSEPEPNSPDQS